jgi:acyl-CoA synthetase (AMP-forming)/AMP-acid ligase II
MVLRVKAPDEGPATLPAVLRSDVRPRPPHDTLVAALEAAATDEAPLFTLHSAKESVSRSARQALESAWRWCKVLRGRGVARGDRIAILMPTGHAFIEAMLGTMLAGAIPVPLATPMTFGSADRYLRNLEAVLLDCDARVLVTYPRIASAAAEAGIAQRLRELITEADLDSTGPAPVPAPSCHASDTAFIQYTSGTTGQPKGAVISHGALVANAFAIAHGLGIGSHDVGVSWLPMFHDMGLVGVVLTAICHPYPIHLMSPESFVLNPRRWLELVSKVGGTLSPAPNFAYEMCVARGGAAEGLRLDSWRLALNGAEPVRQSTAERFQACFAASGLARDVVLPVYGMAESTLAVTFPSVEPKLETLAVDRDALERVGRVVPAPDGRGFPAVSVGAPVAGTGVTVVDETGRPVQAGVVGSILVTGPSLMDGYFRNESASAAVLSDGQLRTGDLGFVDRGRLFVTGRAKEIIIKAGRNLSPHDVERVAGQVDGTRDGCIAAFGRPNPRSGTDDLVVVVESPSSDSARRDALSAALRAEILAVLGVKPDEIRVCGVGAIPRTTSGKIRRRECARLFASGDEVAG